ncbi:MAG: gluconate 2-dehydrogenase gamma chain [Caballeronia sp.]|jgi:gluconate 2-dehydrogenase gamma chain|nr:gluconate 2-dehydrogenase gamma chain [Caballeronia sp.]MEA3123092.1 gluconate 2-dehydrogenase gamma chain [Caballeronia sp.]
MSTEKPPTQRRAFLRKTLAIVPAVSLTGAATTMALSNQGHAADAPEPEVPYEPRYFHPPEWAFIHAAVDRLIPSNDDGPGAVELGVPEFIDRQMEAPYGRGAFWYMRGPFKTDGEPTLGYQLRLTPRELYRAAIAAVDDWCRKTHGKTFAALDGQSLDAVLHQLESGKAELETVPAGIFFTVLLANTKEGYFADPIYGGNKHMGSWKMIGFPGARADYMDWVDQPGKTYPLGPVSISGEKA